MLGGILGKLDMKIGDLELLEFVLDPEFIKDLNCLVTERRIRRPEKEERDLVAHDQIEEGLFEEMNFAEEDDYYQVLNEGPLYGLKDNVRYEFGETADIIELTSYVIEYIASHQIFGNGNKRTSFMVGFFLLLFYQIQNDFEEISVPALTDDFVELIGKVAIDQKEENREQIQNFLEGLREKLVQSSER